MEPSKTQALFERAALADRVGVGVSALCIGHCLMLPILIATLPLWPMAETLHHWMHPIFALLIVPATVVAMHSGFKVHKQWHVMGLLAAGLVVILAAGVIGHQWAGAFTETTLTFLGSGLLIGGHWQNSEHGRRCAPCEDECSVC